MNKKRKGEIEMEKDKTVEFNREARIWGGSLAITIPEEIVDFLDLHPGKHLILTPINYDGEKRLIIKTKEETIK